MEKQYIAPLPGHVIYQLSSDDLWDFGLRLIAKVREDDAEKRKREQTEELGSRQDAAEYLKVSLPTIHAMINRGKIKAVKVGRRTLIDMTDLKCKVANGEIGRYKHSKKW